MSRNNVLRLVESYPHQVPQLEEEAEAEKEGAERPSAPTYPQDPIERARYEAELGAMRAQLMQWRVWQARRILASHDPVKVAWAIADTQDAIETGDVRNPGGVFLWFLKQ